MDIIIIVIVLVIEEYDMMHGEVALIQTEEVLDVITTAMVDVIITVILDIVIIQIHIQNLISIMNTLDYMILLLVKMTTIKV